MSKIKSNPNIQLGRYCEINNIKEISNLEKGMDFRRPEYRREVFLKFYEFHLKYKSHPGAVYYVMPFLAQKLKMNKEQKYWFAYINGCTQNPLSSYVVFSLFPDFDKITFNSFEKWHREYWKRLEFDIDRRYVKGHLVELWDNYRSILNGKTQEEFFENDICNTSDKKENFDKLWNIIINNFKMFGRLSTFSYTEYLKIMGLNIECSSLFLKDLEGSKSHRNGIMKVCGRDDLDWFRDTLNFPGHSLEVINWAEKEGEFLLKEAKLRLKNEPYYDDINYHTLESTLCCYKSWHRENRRYPNVYNDMFYNRIKLAESKGWRDHSINFDIFWDARKNNLPEYLRLEDCPSDPGLKPIKQNWYRNTGQVIMMDKEWSCFENDFLKDNFK